jgi:3',5'-cyclic-AMP phosphodiesterase
MNRARPWRVLQITDLHLREPAGATLLGVDTEATLTGVLDQAFAEAAPDAVLVTGDLAHDPTPSVYRRLRTRLDARVSCPCLVLPGNHDLAEPFEAVFGSTPAIKLDGWRLLGFDSHRDDTARAWFDAAARRALARRLDDGDGHVLLACHHPPVSVGAPWLDKDRLTEAEELLDSWRAHGSVRALAFGHVHQQVEATHDGIRLLGTPSTCFQFEPGSKRFAIDRSPDTGRPGYRWLELHAGGAVTSRVARCDLTLNIDLTDGP